MMFFDVRHENIVCLIQYVRSVTVRSVFFKVAELVHIRIDGFYPFACILCIECVQQFFEISFLFCRIVFKNSQHDLFLFFVFVARGKAKYDRCHHKSNDQ